MYDPGQEKEATDCVFLPITGTDTGLEVFLIRPQSYRCNPRERLFVASLREALENVHRQAASRGGSF